MPEQPSDVRAAVTSLQEILATTQAALDAATAGPWTLHRSSEHSDVQIVTEAIDPATGEPTWIATTGDPCRLLTRKHVHYGPANEQGLRQAFEVAGAETSCQECTEPVPTS